MRSDGTILLCVADGASSSRLAGEAADHVMKSACDLFDRWNWHSHRNDYLWLKQSFSEYLNSIGVSYDDYLVVSGIDPDEFHTTLELALIVGDWILLASIGDGFAVVRVESSGEMLVPLAPNKAAPGGGTYMMADWRAHTRSLLVYSPSSTIVFLSTDGLERHLRFPRVEQTNGKLRPVMIGLQPQLTKLIESIASGETALQSSSLVSPGFAQKPDDLGVACAVR